MPLTVVTATFSHGKAMTCGTANLDSRYQREIESLSAMEKP